MRRQVTVNLSEEKYALLLRRTAKVQEDVPETTVQPGQIARFAVEKYLEGLTEDKLKED